MRSKIVLLMILLACQADENTFPDEKAIMSINETDLKTHLTYLASDEMRGRDTGSKEQEEAANYLAEKLKSYGYQGLGENGSFFQPVPLVKTSYDFESLSFAYGKAIDVKFGETIIVFNRQATDIDENSPVYFALKGGKEEVDSNLIKNAIVIRFAYTQDDMKNGKNDRVATQFLYSKGARMVISLLGDNDFHNNTFSNYARFAMSGSSMGLKSNEIKKSTPFVLLKESVWNEMLKNDSKFDSKKSGNMNATLAFRLKAKEEPVNTKNVVAHLKGNDPKLAGQYIAIGAHYDHVGANENQIFNGADDDGSGTATVLDIAEAFSLKKSKRSIMIIFHTGEEKGLLGSEYYSQSPIIPMDSIVVMLNCDMIGRSNDGSDSTSMTARLTGPNAIYMIGSDKISSQLHTISDSVNNRFVKMEIDMSMNDESHPDRIYYRSDHWNYAKHQVPIIFYFDGIHKDYHKETDTVEKIDFTKMAKVGRLAFITGFHVANRHDRIVKDKVQKVN